MPSFVSCLGHGVSSATEHWLRHCWSQFLNIIRYLGDFSCHSVSDYCHFCGVGAWCDSSPQILLQGTCYCLHLPVCGILQVQLIAHFHIWWTARKKKKVKNLIIRRSNELRKLPIISGQTPVSQGKYCTQSFSENISIDNPSTSESLRERQKDSRCRPGEEEWDTVRHFNKAAHGKRSCHPAATGQSTGLAAAPALPHLLCIPGEMVTLSPLR